VSVQSLTYVVALFSSNVIRQEVFRCVLLLCALAEISNPLFCRSAALFFFSFEYGYVIVSALSEMLVLVY
jgi:hypothetical protein